MSSEKLLRPEVINVIFNALLGETTCMYLEYWPNQAPATQQTTPLLGVPRDNLALWLKRIIDITVSFTVLVLLSPLLLCVAILIKLTSPGPVFHIRPQVGLNQRPFLMWKFRTMIANAEQQEATLRQTLKTDGPFFKVKNDPRITPLGKVLRKYSVDELPQLLNVLKGEMSLVGPRPLFDFEVEKFSEWKYFQRFSMKPGLTCIWQVSGRSDTSDAHRMNGDLEYVKHWSLALDFKILLKTIPVVLKGDGAV